MSKEELVLTIIYAHRGAAGEFPENTMLAFEEAYKQGADGIELDVQLSKDGVPVIIHDESLKRITKKKGMIKDKTYEELRKIDVSFKFPEYAEKAIIPTLEEFLEWVQDKDLLLNIELKNSIVLYKGLEEKTIELCKKYNVCDRVVLSSFNHYSMVLCKKLDPEIKTALLVDELLFEPWKYVKSVGADALHTNYKSLPRFVIEGCVKNNIPVRSYTVNKKEDIALFKQLGIDAIFTDFPKLGKDA